MNLGSKLGLGPLPRDRAVTGQLGRPVDSEPEWPLASLSGRPLEVDWDSQSLVSRSHPPLSQCHGPSPSGAPSPWAFKLGPGRGPARGCLGFFLAAIGYRNR